MNMSQKLRKSCRTLSKTLYFPEKNVNQNNGTTKLNYIKIKLN